jgi:Mlc titration factor MtfA (ptsG expression regulator)
VTDEQLFYSIVGSIAALLIAFWGAKRWRLWRVQQQPFPAAWLRILEQRLPPYRYLPPDLQEQLQQLVKMFLYRKTFVGCAGLEVTDEMRVTIAAEACLLLLNRTTNEYHDLGWIYIYPNEFVARKETRDEAGVVSHGKVGLLGESWTNGRVILSWDDVEQGVRDFTDGRNVVLHEFAHQLDHETGTTNGTPMLRGAHAYKTWASVFATEFAELQRQAAYGERDLLDHYGATNPAEFFAVATETFFEQPLAMRERHAALYEQLKEYYKLDPATWAQSDA